MLWNLKVTVDESRTGGGLLDDGPYSDREPEYVTLDDLRVYGEALDENKLAKMLQKEHDVYPYSAMSSSTSATLNSEGKVGPGMPVHVVLVRYQSGDTFGYTSGLTAVYDVFGNVEDALGLARKIGELADAPVMINGGLVREWGFEYNGRNYHKVWIGFGDRFESVDVRSVIVQVDSSAYRN